MARPNPVLISPEEAAKMLRVSTETVYAIVRAGHWQPWGACAIQHTGSSKWTYVTPAPASWRWWGGTLPVTITVQIGPETTPAQRDRAKQFWDGREQEQQADPMPGRHHWREPIMPESNETEPGRVWSILSAYLETPAGSRRVGANVSGSLADADAPIVYEAHAAGTSGVPVTVEPGTPEHVAARAYLAAVTRLAALLPGIVSPPREDAA